MDLSQSTLELACALIARESVTPQDAGCQGLIAARLTPLGFRCESINYGEVSNLWARRGTARPLVCFAGHTDVVPPGPLDAWHSPPFEPVIRDGRLYGRGAADMKSSLAAFVTAIESFIAGHPAHGGSIAMLLTSDEEGPALDGTVRVIERLAARGECIDFCVVGEPSSSAALGDTIRHGRRGSLSGRLEVRGIQGHVAYPELVRNPIHQIAPALAELAATVWDAGNAHFPPTSFQVSGIHAGTGATNVVPGALVLDFNLRFSPESPAPALRSRIEALLSRHGLDFSLDWTLGGEPYYSPPAQLVDAVRDAVARHCGLTPQLSTGGGTSDGRFIARICSELVELGPVNASIHKLDEHVTLADLHRLPLLYRELLQRLLA